MLRISDLLAHGRSHVKGLYSARTGKTFDADLVLTETTNKDGQRIVSYELDFPKNSKRSGCDHPNRKPATGSLCRPTKAPVFAPATAQQTGAGQ